MTQRLIFVLSLSAVMTLAVGCNQQPNDSQIKTEIQSKLNTDSGLQGKELTVQADNGKVTLSGSVDNEAQREAALRYASAEPGVKQVVSNLQIASTTPAPMLAAEPTPASAPPSPAVATAAPQTRTSRTSKPSPSNRRPDRSERPLAEQRKRDIEQYGDLAKPYDAPPATPQEPIQTAVAAPAPAPPPPPVRRVTISSGTTLAVRLIDALDSATVTQGQTFHATLDAPLTVDGETAIPSGVDVEGHVTEVDSAGKFTGKSSLTLQLDRIAVGSKTYTLQTDTFNKEGSSRGKNTAEKVGGGALLGAIIGGLAGGGKGAGIGAAAGAGVGGGVQAATHGKQVKLPAETVLHFTLQSALTVTPTANGPDANRPKLEKTEGTAPQP